MTAALRSGRWLVGPKEGSLRVMTRREGAAARLGHDLTLLATRWKATVHVDAANPARSRVELSVDARSLVVASARGGAVPLTEAQKAEIARITRDTVLVAGRHRTITFTSTSVVASARIATIEGQLRLAGATRSVAASARLDGRSTGAVINARATIVQTEFGITPYSALLGALRLKDVVTIALRVRLHR